MGIPKLMQDLLPYAEDVVLGSTAAEHVLPVVDKLVIDGPSLVFFVYSRLVKRSKTATVGPDAQPTYTEISSGVVEFLTDLRARDIHIEAIYFDGALPVEKREIRLERLARSHATLQAYRRQHPGPFKPSIPGRSRVSRPSTTSSIWQQDLPAPWRPSALPHPPFLVPCILEALKRYSISLDDAFNASRGTVREVLTLKNILLIVPGEADSYCAATAKSTGAAVLSNDSDLTLYDLGSEGCVVLLDSLELVTSSGTQVCQRTSNPSVLKAQRLHPARIADKLKLPSQVGGRLLRLGFERARDTTASAGTIRTICRKSTPSCQVDEAFDQFSKQYSEHDISNAIDSLKAFPQLDPRVSELYWQFNHTTYAVLPPQHPHMYLPIMIEDPTRDSSWAYGKHLRILAYSLLNISENSLSESHKHVIEFQRRGSRVCGVAVELMDRTECTFALRMLTQDLTRYASGPDELLQWRLFSFREVVKQKHENGKLAISSSWVAKFLTNGYVGDGLSWEDIHVYANVQSVLYSLWILKQLSSVSKLMGELERAIHALNQTLMSLVSITQLVAGRAEIPNTSTTVSEAIVAEAFQDLYSEASEPSDLIQETEERAIPATSRRTGLSAGKRHRASDNIFELLSSTKD